MIKAFVGSGGKTTLLKKTAAHYRAQGKTVFVTTTTHMFIEEDTLLTDDADTIIRALKETGYAMAGLPNREIINTLSPQTYAAVCPHADVILVEADGSRRKPLKFPNSSEPVIPDNAEEIVVVCGLNALGHRAKDVCHRLELVKERLGIQDDTRITPTHVQTLVTEGYLRPLRKKYPEKKISLAPRHDGSLYQRAIASLLEREQDVSCLREEWFCPQPQLAICGGGHVAAEAAAPAFQEPGVLCIITEKHGSAPSGVGSILFVGKDRVLGSIGGSAAEHQAICQAREDPSFAIRQYSFPDPGAVGSGTIQVLFIPV